MEEVLCKGSLQLGTGCKKCSKCFTQLEEQNKELTALLKMITKYRYCMSYNSSYFGEPEGYLKAVVGDIERLLPSGNPLISCTKITLGPK